MKCNMIITVAQKHIVYRVNSACHCEHGIQEEHGLLVKETSSFVGVERSNLAYFVMSSF